MVITSLKKHFSPPNVNPKSETQSSPSPSLRLRTGSNGASSSAGLRTIKRVEHFLQELKVNLKPKVPTKAVCAKHLELRKEILTLLNLQKLLQNKEEGSSYRESSYTESQDTPKRLQCGMDQDRAFIPYLVSFGAMSAERVGKRDQKRKDLQEKLHSHQLSLKDLES